MYITTPHLWMVIDAQKNKIIKEKTMKLGLEKVKI